MSWKWQQIAIFYQFYLKPNLPWGLVVLFATFFAYELFSQNGVDFRLLLDFERFFVNRHYYSILITSNRIKHTSETLNHLILRRRLNLASWAAWNWNFGIHQLEVAHSQKRYFPVPTYPLIIRLQKLNQDKRKFSNQTLFQPWTFWQIWGAAHCFLEWLNYRTPFFTHFRPIKSSKTISGKPFRFWTFQEQALHVE